jgi:hypothetical protein
MSRPFFNFRISELEAEFARRKDNADFLRDLVQELGYRSVARALSLKAQAVKALASLEEPPTNERFVEVPPARIDPVHDSTSAHPPLQSKKIEASVRQGPPIREVTNSPGPILDAWTALEVLSPQKFSRPEDLVPGGDRQGVAWLDRERLPWEGSGEKSRRNMKLFYQVVLGTVDLDSAFTELLARFGDSRVERPSVKGEAILAVVVVDREGRLVEAPAVSVSSFAWGIPRAARGDLEALSQWRTAERSLVEGVDELLRRGRDDEQGRPLDRVTMTAGWEWLVARLGLQQELVTPPRFAIRSFEYYKSSEPPEPLLLNSFFLNDLDSARTLFSEGKETRNLRRYIGCEVPATRRDLLHDTEALEAAVAPEMTPTARWPGPGRHPLVILQQAAVNLALSELSDDGILAVNGPPGTGKTTLLRDLVAGIVTSRAEVMAGFGDPVKAFVHSGERLRAGQVWAHLYHLDAKLKGFEMIVASSNNKAVENVSATLPSLGAIAEDAGDLRYFQTLSDELLKRETWGLVAAILGNAANRARFKRSFWWDDEVGLSYYLAEAAGTPQLIEVVDQETGIKEIRPPKIISNENPPRSHDEALRRWEKARTQFRACLRMSRKNLEELARLREVVRSLPTLAREESEAAAGVLAAQGVEDRAQVTREATRVCFSEARSEWTLAEERLAAHDRTTPGFLARLFRTRQARGWQLARRSLQAARDRSQETHSRASKEMSAAQEGVRQAVAKRQIAERNHAAAADRYTAAQYEVAAARERIGVGFIDADFFSRDRADLHKTSAWLTAEQQRARDDVFVSAMALHRAFIDAAAKPLRNNLRILMDTLGGRKLPTPEKRALMPDLWASLFLVVPLISTTFASVERMLGALPADSLGWLFVDEAGQAAPQAAVGAIMRSRRAVVVGDPMQIEPVVMLPDSLTQSICRHFGVDPDRFNAPDASVQTLADAATSYFAEFETRDGSRSVGVPLLMHRRCAEPMFGISNAVAYQLQMVYATPKVQSRIGDVLGPSTWFDVRGSAAEKWCAEEGEMVLTLLRRLAQEGVDPDLYIITPFVIVEDNLRRVVRESGILTQWSDDPWKWTSERIGTIHTVQGREAKAVILVLGAPSLHQAGARGWAGSKPNLLNVAVTRAKERLYVIGNRSLWREANRFRELDARLPKSQEPAEYLP